MSGNTSNNDNGTFPYPPVWPVGAWWTQMVVVAILNLLFFAFTWYKTRSNLRVAPEERRSWSYQYSKWMRLLAIPVVFQTTWRAFLPSQYDDRKTVIQDDVNSVLVARLLAFFGEISWGIQVAWATQVIARHMPLRGSEEAQKRVRTYIPRVSYYLVFAVITGNIFSVIGTITANSVFFVVEETFWATIYFFGAVCNVFLWYFVCDSWSFDWGRNCFGYRVNPFLEAPKEAPKTPASVWVMRLFIRVYAIIGLIATVYMVVVDIPKWYDQWRTDEKNGVEYFGFVDGIVDAATRQVATQVYAEWEQDVLWMSVYFSFAVWASILLMYAPGRVAQGTCADHSGGGGAFDHNIGNHEASTTA